MRRSPAKADVGDMECQICFESQPDMYKVPCGSTVAHKICFGCERRLREEAPIRDGKRKITCPFCRQEETSRTIESLERELAALYVSRQAPQSEQEMVGNAYEVFLGLHPTPRAYMALRILATTPDTSLRPATPVAQFCESGRDCRTRSRINSRCKTTLKCRTCREVACCRSCGNCTGCVPLVPSS
jgi:hypothetical protein